MSARRDFHYALATAFIPVLLLPVAWWLAWRQLRSKASDALERVWRRRLLALAVFDTFAALAVVAAFALTGGPPAIDPGSPRIGVQLDSAYQGPGARVQSVWQASPAARAGLLKGDVIVAVDGAPVVDWQALTDIIASGQHLAPRALTVRRGNRELGVEVLPEVGLQVASAPRSPFAPQEGVVCRDAWAEQARGGLMPVGLGTGLVLLLWFLGWRRAPGERRRWGVVAVPLALAPLVGAGTSYVSCVGFGAFSLGVVLLGLVGQGTALLAFGALILWLLGSELDVIIGPRLSTGYASQLAVFYVFSVIARALMTLGALWTFFPNLRQGQDRAIGVLFESLDDPLGRGLMILAAVVLAPLAEEVIFRGVLLPGLARQMHPGTALWISAALFALFHVPSHGLGAVFPGLLGVVFGWARLRTGSLLAPIMLHAANNLLVTVLAWSQ